MNRNLRAAYSKLKFAKQPEDIFGPLSSNKQKSLQKRFRHLVRGLHPDCFTDKDNKELASECFKLLVGWRNFAKGRIVNHNYINSAPDSPNLVFYGKKGVYEVLSDDLNYFETDICSCCLGQNLEQKNKTKVLIKIVSNSKNNDLMRNEAKNLRTIFKGSLRGTPILAQLPDLIESVEIDDGKTQKIVNIFENLEGYVSLEEVIKAYPQGVHSADMAWMWRRLMAAMVAAHSMHLVHGAVLPCNYFINPETHNGVLVNWSCSTRFNKGLGLPIINLKYKEYYPPEVRRKEAYEATDIYMSALCMVVLLGGNIKNRTMPKTIPDSIVGLLKSCLISNPNYRTRDLIKLNDEFKKALKELYGIKFRKFEMPKKD